MSEDRLEKALEALKNEPIETETMETAQKRVRQNLEGGTSLCHDFRNDFPNYLQNKLSGNRRLLLEDHLSRCPDCRTHLAEMKGERKINAMPERRASRWPRWTAWAAAASIVLGMLYLGRGSIDTLLAPRGPIATVVSADGSIFQVPDGTLKTGDPIYRKDVVRTTADAHARLRLADGSLIDINGNTELHIQGAWSGNSIQLKRGDIIVQAAEQRRGHLRVQTRDSVTSVKGTIFAVSSGISGTLVSVIEGSVAVEYTGTDILLSPGEQESTNPQLESTVQQAIEWSPNAEDYTDMLASLVQVERQIAELPIPQLPGQSQLLPYIPSNMFIYGAIPNFGDNIDQTVAIIEDQVIQNPFISEWWNSNDGQSLQSLIVQIQTITTHLGNEIVFGFCPDTTSGTGIPVILATLQPGGKAPLDEALQKLVDETGSASLPYYIDDTLLVASNSEANLIWIAEELGKGSATPFASEIASRYNQGSGGLLAIDIQAILSMAEPTPELVHSQKIEYIFLNKRNMSGIPENEITVEFKAPRTGFTSFLANTGSGGAAEYISSETLFAGYIATREPQQIFEELLAQATQFNPASLDELSQTETSLGIDFSNDLAYAFGTESAFSIENVSTSGPAWTLAVMVNDSAILEDSIQKLVDIFNIAFEEAGGPGFISLTRENIDGRTWTTLQPDWQTFGLTWTYDRGYMVAASDHATALRAIATREDGFPLVWSASFQQQLPASAGLHPSGFLWLNATDALQDIASLIENPAYLELINGRDPILVAVNAETEQIRAVSRTSLLSIFMDAMVFQGLGTTNTEQPD